MARTLATLPAGSRITDYISLGVIARFFPAEKVRTVLKETFANQSQRVHLLKSIFICFGPNSASLLSPVADHLLGIFLLELPNRQGNRVGFLQRKGDDFLADQ